jgi:adenine-specific DNA methylase
MTRRLIEDELPLARVNAESKRDKSLRHGHISTMHLWWARRPLAMSRAVVAGSLIADPANEDRRRELSEVIADASRFEASNRTDLLRPLAEEIRRTHGDRAPRVLDCFAGGGAIPLEALRLGCETTALDLNPVAHLVELCALDYPQRFGQPDEDGSNPLADDFVKWAQWVGERAEGRLAAAFPTGTEGRRPAVYFWSRTMRCLNPTCGVEIPLVTSRWLANSSRKAWLDFSSRDGVIDVAVRQGPPPPGTDPREGTVKGSSVNCPACRASFGAEAVRRYAKGEGLGRRMLATMDVKGSQRAYREPRDDEVAASAAGDYLEALSEGHDGVTPVPDEAITPSQFRILRSLVFGIDTWAGLFNARQLLVLGTLCEEVRAAHAEMLAEGASEDRARAVATYLGLLVDKMVDYNSSFTSWAPGGEFQRGTFPQQAIAMVWDYVESDPFHSDRGIWKAHTKWIELAIRHCSSASSAPARVVRGNAQELPFENDAFDAVIVDPPYYDSFQYGDLSDLFYVWLKRSVGHLYPALFTTPLSSKRQEIIESRADRKSAEFISHEEFEARLQRALTEIKRVVTPDGIVALVFAHTDVEAWERLLRGLRAAGLVVSTSWPMRSERAARPTAQISATLDSSVVLVCRPSEGGQTGFYDDVVRELDERIAERLAAFEGMGLVGADYFVSAVGPAFEVFARYERVVKLSGEEVEVGELMVLARQAVARHALRRLLGDESTLSRVDAQSLFYLTWRWAYGSAALPIDEVYKLERAFDVDIDELQSTSGVFERRGSSARLLGPHEHRDIELAASPALIDVLHVACRLWDAGRRADLERVLAATGAGVEPGFWACATVLAELLPDGDRERTMLLGLTGNRDRLASAAEESAPEFERLVLFEDGQLSLAAEAPA